MLAGDVEVDGKKSVPPAQLWLSQVEILSQGATKNFELGADPCRARDELSIAVLDVF